MLLPGGAILGVGLNNERLGFSQLLSIENEETKSLDGLW